MPMTVPKNTASWSFDDHRIHLSCGLLKIDTAICNAFPDQFRGFNGMYGFGGLSLNETPLPQLILYSVCGNPESFGRVEDMRVSGEDFVVVYAPHPEYPVRATLQFTARPILGASGASIQLTIFEQADSTPASTGAYISMWWGGEFGEVGQELVDITLDYRKKYDLLAHVIAIDSATICYAWHPQSQRTQSASDGSTFFRARLRPAPLERGVTRCWRHSTFIFAGQPPGEEVRRVMYEFADAPLPLTT
jgi:hypothetical protein